MTSYRIVITGPAPGTNPSEVASALARIFSMPAERLLPILRASRFEIKKGLPVSDAARYEAALRGAGCAVVVEPEIAAIDAPLALDAEALPADKQDAPAASPAQGQRGTRAIADASIGDTSSARSAAQWLERLLAQPESICAAVLIALFFVPWVSFGGFISLSGYEIPKVIKGMGQLAAAFSKNAETNWRILLFDLLYLLPVLGVVTVVVALIGRRTSPPAIATAAVPLSAFAYALPQSGTDVFKAMAIGSWLSLIVAVATILFALRVIKLPAPTPLADIAGH